MSCNCNNRPCTCPSANCSCPPNYVVNPATLTCSGTQCEDTISTSCIFTDSYLSCSAQVVGTDLDTVLLAMDAKICECAGCSGNTHISPDIDNLKDYWVDSSNTVPGDGSVTNPFWTMELAYNKIIGSGTTALPENPNVTVHVAEGVGYSTQLNIYIPTIAWIFAPNANVTFTGDGVYFIDSNAVTGATSQFSVYGNLNFITSTGGFLRNTHSYYSGDKVIYCEANSVVGNTSGTGLPFIAHYQTNAVAAWEGVADTTIKLSNPTSIIISATNTLASITGGRFKLDLNGGRAWYGYNTQSSQAAGVSGGNVILYNNSDSSLYNYLADFIFKNGSITSLNATDMIYVGGNFSSLLIEDIKVGSTFNANKPATFLNVGNVTLVQTAATDYEFTFLLRDVILDPNAFATAAPLSIINYSGSQQVLDYLNMADCILYYPATIDSAIRLGKISQGLNPVATKNIINGNLRFTNLPTSASGLTTGEVWSNSGVLTIV